MYVTEIEDAKGSRTFGSNIRPFENRNKRRKIPNGKPFNRRSLLDFHRLKTSRMTVGEIIAIAAVKDGRIVLFMTFIPSNLLVP